MEWPTAESPLQQEIETQQTTIEDPNSSTDPPYVSSETYDNNTTSYGTTTSYEATTRTTTLPPSTTTTITTTAATINSTHCVGCSSYWPSANLTDWRVYVDKKLAGGSNKTSLWVAIALLAVCLVAVVLPMLVYLFLKLRPNQAIANNKEVSPAPPSEVSPAPLSDAFGISFDEPSSTNLEPKPKEQEQEQSKKSKRRSKTKAQKRNY